ncbi:hypothetical protein AMTR_s00111p00072510 [Amborella trichopoda]|uniref:Uncharacterized protein n=2 Tax=Amborella trichopoda TaxID=13333 RepID=W1NX13_AMBTC|nr:hypothetical protein AMTR_s00111p00072510 [Amborella trichopoda]
MIDAGAMRKGPWMPEEDEILLEYVRHHGPRDWSAIRSKGLLPRTGKSCRLRWVNKLKPDLKTGCKFSPEEERIVIELQAKFGNKWARIATYLPGRTDNDVKNFWSTRQKRLARTLQVAAPLPPPPPPCKALRPLIGSSEPAAKAPVFEDFVTFQNPTVINTASSDQISLCRPNPLTPFSQVIPTPQLPDLVRENLPILKRKPSLHELRPKTELQIQEPPLDLHLLPANSNPIPFFAEENFTGLPGHEFRQEIRGDEDFLATPDGFFDDFPVDMFDLIEPLPPPTSPNW